MLKTCPAQPRTWLLLGAPLAALVAMSCSAPAEGDGTRRAETRQSAIDPQQLEVAPQLRETPPDLKISIPSGATCGTPVDGVCEPGTFCKMPAGACTEAFPPPSGRCTTTPDVCPSELDPVCGCDGITYGNACRAHQGGTSIAHSGFCEPAARGEPCGVGLLEPHCEAELYCAFETGACLDPLVGAEGSCEMPPRWCSLQWDPVCGCDGVTYGNACVAASHGQSIAHPSPCDQSTEQ